MLQFGRSRLRFASMAAVGVLLLVNCGGGGDSNGELTRNFGSRPDLPVDARSADGLLPPVTVRDLTHDQWVQFANFLPSDKPVLVWFWAPH